MTAGVEDEMNVDLTHAFGLGSACAVLVLERRAA